MLTLHEAINEAIREVTSARSRLSKVNSKQVRNADDVGMLKATADTWFHTHRPVIVKSAPTLDLNSADGPYAAVLDATTKSASKSTYVDALKLAKAALINIRKSALVAPAVVPESSTDDLAPDFSPLAGNQQMRDVLTRRWYECAKCVNADAHLAAIVMMGGLLEALFVARANKMGDKKPLTSAVNAPKDKNTGKTLNYQEWMLDSYIKVGHELRWITESAKAIADTIKEYRNFVHPAKELRYGVTLGLNDSSMFWQITKALSRQLLMSA